jgi:DNA-binding LacI/PurR family transcriptional regulator
MSSCRILTASEQVAAHLRQEMAEGVRTTLMPGATRLSAELEVGHNTVEAALRQLEKEGWLIPKGAGRKRQIVLPKDNLAPRSLRVEILVCEPGDEKLEYILELHRQLAEAGHSVRFASKTLYALGRDVRRLARFVKQTEADAWVILCGSHEELEWFAKQSVPSFALFGHVKHVALPSIAPDKLQAMRSAVHRLHSLGHRRIVLTVRPDRRIPGPGLFERAFLKELEALGIPAGPYHLPNWEESSEGYHAGLDSLFKITPPTAIFIDEAQFVSAAFQFLTSRGLRVPEDVSLICTDPDPSFAWCQPSIAHISWESHPWVRRIVRWASNITRGKEDHRQSLSKSEFIDGGTIGPAKKN